MLAPLDNETFFKKAFTDKIVFEQFIKDIFDIKVNVAKIETEKKFAPKAGYIDLTIDIYAETTDNRFIIEIQRMDYDHNFDRFLHYFLQTITEQQKTSKDYIIKQEVLAIVVLTQPYRINKKTGQAIQDNVMTLDFDLKNLKGEVIRIWGHNLVFLNPHPKYENPNTPANYQDWLDLIQQSVKNKINYKLNLNNAGISKAIDLIDFKNLTPEEVTKAKIAEGKRVMRLKDREEIEQKVKKTFAKQIEQKDQALEQKDQALEQKDQALEQKDQTIMNSAKAMLKSGMSVKQVREITKLSKQQIENL